MPCADATAMSLIGLLLLSLADIGQAQGVPDQVLFGPKQYLRTSGAPNQYTDTFTVPASIGAPFQLHIVNGQANGANRISSAWIAVNGVQIAGPNDFGQNVASIDRTITVQPTNTLTVKVASAPGAYLTITVYGTKILPTPASLTPNPLTLTMGATGTLTATVAPTPTASGTLMVSSGTPSVVTVPASVPFTAGQSSVAVPVNAVGVGSGQVTVSTNGGSVASTVQVTPAPPTITDLRPSTLTVTQGGSGTLTVAINAAQATATAIALQSSASGIASVPSSVTVLAGQTSATAMVVANTPGTAQITASLNGTSAASTITVSAALPTLISLLPPTTRINLGASGTLTATISAAQSGGTPINITASPSGLVTIPATVTVPAGQLTVPLPFTTVGLGTAMIHVTLNGSTADAAVQVTPPPPVVVSLLPSSLPVVVNATGQLTVTLNAAQLTNTDVALSTDNSSVLQLPPAVTVPAGQIQAVFTITGLAIGDATVTATLGTSGKSAVVHVQPPPATVVSLLPNPLPLQQGATGSLTLTLNAAQLADTVITLSNTAPTIANIPSSETVPAGQISTSIAVSGLQPGTATISAALNGATVSSTIQVTAPPPIVTILTPLTMTLPKGTPGVLTVTVSPAPTVATPITLSSSATGVATVPATVTIPAGALSADFPVLSVGEGNAIITASLNGGSAASTITVTPAELVTLTLSPQSLTLIVGEVQPFTATGTMTDGTTPDFTTRVTWASSNQNVATVDTSGFATALALGVTTISASFTTSSGPVSTNTTVTVLTPPALTMTPTTATLRVAETVNITINSASPARYGGLLITLTPSGIGRVLAPLSVQLLEGQSSATVTITGTVPGAVTLTATAPARLAGTSTMTIIPQPPIITGFSPMQGPVGTTVTIAGANFETAVLGNNSITFNGTQAIVNAGTATTLTVTVPLGATNGTITATTTGGTATSTGAFSVTHAQDFSLAPTPGAVTVAQVGSSTYQVQVNNTGPSSFTGFVGLNVNGLPAGVTATFIPPGATITTPSTLLLTSTTAAAAGTYTMTITGTGTVDGGTVQRTTRATLTILPTGTSTLSGRVLASKDHSPIAGVTLKLGAQTVLSDAGGNFLMANAPAGPQIIFVDGETASTATVKYPIVPIPVTIVAGQDNQLPWAVYLHEMSTAFTPIDPSQDTLVTDPKLPNFMLKIPAGAQIIGWDGQPNTQVAVTAVPIDRNALAPFPDLGNGKLASDLFLFNFGKPGGGNPTQPIPIIMPNTFGNDPGTVVDLYYYDESLTPDPNSNQWRMFGIGRVSADGLKIIPDPGVGIPKFCCGGGASSPPPPPPPPDPQPLPTGTDPVILTTGQFMVQVTDLVLPGRVPVVIQRMYRSPEIGFSAVGTLGIFGQRTTLGQYNETLLPVGTQTLSYVSNFGRALLTVQPDGTYTTTQFPTLLGVVATRNVDGTGQVRLKDGTVLAFDTSGRLITRTDRNGNAVSIIREAGGRIREIHEPAGRAITFQYDSANRVTQLTDPIGRTVQYEYDSTGRLIRVTNPENGVTSYAYDSAGRILTITDARGITYLTNEYDATGRVIRQTQADGGVWTLAYTVVGSRVTQTVLTDPGNHATTHRFDAQGHEMETVDALGQPTRQTYSFATTLLQNTRDPLNRITKFTYDAAGNTTSILDPAGNPTLIEYEPTFNRLTKLTDALSQSTQFTIDLKGNLVATTDPLTHSTTLTYNLFGQPLTMTDPLTHTTQFVYDDSGNLIQTIDPMGNPTQRTYDAVSRLVALTDARGKTTEFRYDGLNRVTQITDPLNGLTKFTYDPNGNLLTVTDAKNQVTTYTYDNMDRLLTRTDALNRVERYEYDLAGNLTKFTDRKDQVTMYTNDALNRRIGASFANGSSVTFVYDPAGRLTRAIDSSSGPIEFVYDVLDRLVQETAPQGTVTYQYDVLGRRTTMTVSGQQPVNYGYDAASRLVQVQQNNQTVGLGYDAANRRTALTYSNSTSSTYSYDAASRLTTILHQGPSAVIDSLTYVYDAAGNRTSATRLNDLPKGLPPAVQAAYDAANEQIQFNSSTPNLSYDANGNLTSQTDASGTITYTWDARNRLTARSGTGINESYTYDALGRRISKTINGVTTGYQYDGNDIATEIGGGTVAATYLRGLNIDEPFVRQSGGNEYYHTDALGSVVALTNDAGIVATSYGYEPFGKTTISGISTNPF